MTRRAILHRARTSLLFFLIALPGCGMLNRPAAGPPPDPELAAASSAARVAYERGLVREAADLYERALTRARAMDDPAEIANAAYNTAACLIPLAQYDRANDLLAEATNELPRSGGRTADVLLMQARVAWLQGRTSDALSIADDVLSQNPPALASERVQAHCLKGRIACDASDPLNAAAELARARSAATDATDPISQARLAELSGRVALLQGRPAQAAADFDRESRLLQQARLYADMTQALARAAAAYEGAGENPSAAERFYRAARSSYAQGDTARALRLIKSARQLTQSPGNDPISRAIESLAREIAGLHVPTEVPPPLK